LRNVAIVDYMAAIQNPIRLEEVAFCGLSFSGSADASGGCVATVVNGSASNYVYNALGQLIEKSGNGGTTLIVYDEAGHILGEYTATGALIEETIWMGDAPVATLQPNGSSISIYYIHSDHLGTPRKITRPSDNGLMWRWDPDTFGSVAPNTNPAGLGTFIYNLRFPGQYALPESGLYYNSFRDYDPQTGRYIESDPIGVSAGAGTYTYVHDGPISKFDFLGLDDKITGEKACKLVDSGYNPDNDPCGCQKDVVNSLCGCWRKYGAALQFGQLAVCTEKAYFTKSKCIQDCSLSSCNRQPPKFLGG